MAEGERVGYESASVVIKVATEGDAEKISLLPEIPTPFHPWYRVSLITCQPIQLRCYRVV